MHSKIQHFRPILAGKVDCELTKLRYPVLATPKLDGIRCMTIEGIGCKDAQSIAVSRTLKSIPNRHTYQAVCTLPVGLDGELMTYSQGGKPSPFNVVQGNIMAFEGTPNFRYVVFDYVIDPDAYFDRGYEERVRDLHTLSLPGWCIKLQPKVCWNADELQAYEAQCLAEGYEGICFRSPKSKYKFGRSTVNEQHLLKLKRFEDHDAEVIGFEELHRNQNEPHKNELGYQRRQSLSEGMVPADTLGSLIVRDRETGVEFNIGSGFTDMDRIEIWSNLDKYRGRLVKYKCQAYGQKDKPRMPIFLGFREDV